MIGGAKIVALGENSHGSAPIYKFKLRLIQYLVREMDFKVFALESPTVEADKINDYVIGGQGATDDVVRNLAYKSWQTEEMIDIIKWIKSYNETASSKVEFRGFDMQNGNLALQFVFDFSLKHDKKLEGEIENVKALYENNKKTEKDWVNLVEHIRIIQEYMSTRTATDYNDLDEAEFSKLNHYIDILSQSISLMHPSESIKSRDELMADNIEWINRNCGDCKIIVSADNDHIRKTNGKTGYFLNQAYGEEYLAFGMTFNKGTYSAYGPEEFYMVHPSYTGTYEYLFSKCKFDDFYFELRKINDIPLLTKSSGFRIIGSRPQETTQFAEMDLKSNFDIMVYFEHSTHTRYIMK
jgi:erythromycin esterase